MKKHSFFLSFLMLVALVLCLPVTSSADYLDNWHLSCDTPYFFRGVTYGNGKFVAVGDGGIILSSPDAITWTKRTSGTTENLNTPTYGKGKFVIVGNHGTILISSDGETWIPRTPYSGTTANLFTVTYGNGTFVAATGGGGTVLTSPDGYTWTTRTELLPSVPYRIGYYNGFFVAVGAGGRICISPDGVEWTQGNSYIRFTLYSVAYGNETFVAVGENGSVFTSVDGLEWTERNSGTSDTLYGLTFANGTFVAVGENDTIMTSYDGIEWTRRFPGIGAHYLSIVYAQSTFLAVAGSYGQIIQSDPVPPDAPSSLIAKAISSSRMFLSWTDRSSDEEGFKIERKEGGCASTNEWSEIAVLGRDEKKFSDKGLTANTNYAYRVRAFKGDSHSDYSNCASSKTALAGTPNAPIDLCATAISQNRIRLTWADKSKNEEDFRTYRKVGSAKWELLAKKSRNVVACFDKDAPGNTILTTYNYYIKACNDSGCSPATNSATVPYRPIQLIASRVFSTQINLKWTDKSANETGFELYRKLGDCASKNPWLLMNTTGPNVTTYINKGLTSGTTYSYRVRAFTKSSAGPYAYGYSLYSNCLCVTTP
jgi:hypothetical protein